MKNDCWLEMLRCSDRFAHLEAIHIGHIYVEHYDIEIAVGGFSNGLRTSTHGRNVETELLEVTLQGITLSIIVIDG